MTFRWWYVIISVAKNERGITKMTKINWMKHCELINEYCDVRYATQNAIWYYEDGYGYCETITGDTYSCNNWDEFNLICKGT